MMWRKQTRPPHDPTWIFSTWPIPRWTGSSCYLTVTASDGPPWLVSVVDYVYPGPTEQGRLQALLDRLGIVGGAVHMTEGTFVLSGPLHLSGVGDIVVNNRFEAE